MPTSNRIILTDVDGVLLQWEKHFREWMAMRGFELRPNFEKSYSMEERYGIKKVLKENLIEEFIKETSENNNLNLEYTKIFVNDNLNKIKYDKYKKKIVDIHGMVKCIDNNEPILKIKVKDKKNTNINKLRKSLINIKKNNIK